MNVIKFYCVVKDECKGTQGFRFMEIFREIISKLLAPDLFEYRIQMSVSVTYAVNPKCFPAYCKNEINMFDCSFGNKNKRDLFFGCI
jgi:hypothetical protein